MYTFKRSNTMARIMMFIGALSALLAILFFPAKTCLTFSVIGIVAVAISFICDILRPSFKYTIVLGEDGMIFEFSENDHRPISRYFCAHVRKRQITLSDKSGVRMTLSYNEDFLKFLQKAQKQ